MTKSVQPEFQGKKQGNQRAGLTPADVYTGNIPFDDGQRFETKLARIVAWLRTLGVPNQVVELRIIRRGSFGKIRSGYFDHAHMEDMAREALDAAIFYEDTEGVYCTLNPVNPALLARRANVVGSPATGETTSDADITARKWLLIDADPTRSSGVSSTEEEKALALESIENVWQFLEEQGWPAPVFADSGNGYHLLYRVGLPVNDRGLVKGILTALANRFSTNEVKIDTSVFNPSRLGKLSGTKARKGDDTAERPHRWSEVLQNPVPLQAVPLALLQTLAEEGGAVTIQPHQQVSRPDFRAQQTSRKGFRAQLYAAYRADWMRRASAYLAKVAPAVTGNGGHNRTFHVACILVLGFDLSVEDAFTVVQDWNARCDPPWSEMELWHKLEDADKKPDRRGYLL